ncbi:phosphotransferase family protein [Kitasatospora sp. NPDC058170]|uniref:phosphotransferase family protein n=1 Tax=Kitasatospora sp. NPDC058170 TaxID=3346364 RepID=UPI0036DF77AF
MEPHVGWDELPAAVRAVVEERDGEVLSAETVPEGITCRTALILSTATARLFLKGALVADRGSWEAQRMEAGVNAAVGGVGPAMRWEAVVDGWHLVAFDHVDGRHADLTPRSGDAAIVADVLRRARSCRAPGGGLVPSLAERYRRVLRPGDAEALEGSSLLHTDTNPHNLLIASRCGYLVDWAMPAVGPAWVDAAQTAVRLMGYGWEPRDARAWLGGFPEWEHAARAGRAVFVRVVSDDATARFGPYAEGENARFRALLG